MFLGGAYIARRCSAAFELAKEYVQKLTKFLRVEADAQTAFLAHDVFCPYIGFYEFVVALFQRTLGTER